MNTTSKSSLLHRGPGTGGADCTALAVLGFIGVLSIALAIGPILVSGPAAPVGGLVSGQDGGAAIVQTNSSGNQPSLAHTHPGPQAKSRGES